MAKTTTSTVASDTVSTVAPETRERRTYEAPVTTIKSDVDRVELSSVSAREPNVDTSYNKSRDADAQTVTGDSLNQSVSEAPRKEEKKKAAMTIEELQEKRRSGVLSIDEAQALNDMENAKQPSGDASVKELHDKDLSPTDPEKNSFKEDDVINYMYNHFLIDGAMWADQKIRKYGCYGYDRLSAAVQERNREKRAEKKKMVESSTYKDSESIRALHKEKQKEIQDQSKENIKTIKAVSQAIKDGSLFNEGNEALLEAYKGIVKADTKDGAEKLAQVQSACESYNQLQGDETKEGKAAFKQSRKESAGLAADFASHAYIDEAFNSTSKIIANNMAAAHMIDTLSREKGAYRDIEASYAEISATQEKDIVKASADDRRLAHIGGPQFIAENAENGGMSLVNQQLAWESTKLGKLEEKGGIGERSEEAFDMAISRIKNGHFVENGKEPKANKDLQAATIQISKGIYNEDKQEALRDRVSSMHERMEMRIEQMRIQALRNGGRMSMQDAARTYAMNDAIMHDMQVDRRMASLSEEEVARRERHEQMCERHPLLAKLYGNQNGDNTASVSHTNSNNNNNSGWRYVPQTTR